MDCLVRGEGRRKRRMAVRRAWAWDLEEMRNAGAALNDDKGTQVTEYDYRCCQYTSRHMVLNIIPGITPQSKLCLYQALPQLIKREIPQE